MRTARSHRTARWLAGVLPLSLAFAPAGPTGGGVEDAPAPYVAPREHELVGLGVDGVQVNGGVFNLNLDMSSDGRYVVWQDERALDPLDENLAYDIYWRDLVTGETRWVSVGNGAGQTILLVSGATNPSVSDDGRYVTFQSTAALLPEDTNEYRDIYVRDMQTGELEMVTDGERTAVWAGHSNDAHISGDGRYVVFRSSAGNLVEGDENEGCDDFLHDRVTGTTEIVSLMPDGRQPPVPPVCSLNFFGPQVSDDGRFVAFVSNHPQQTDDAKLFPTQIYLRDRQLGTTTLVSRNAADEPANYSAMSPTITPNGRFVSFTGAASNLVPGDRDGDSDAFVWDAESDTVEMVSVDSAGMNPGGTTAFFSRTSDDGRFAFFVSFAEHDGPDGTYDYHLWRRDRLTGALARVDTTAAGEPSRGSANQGAVPSADGRLVAFSHAGNDLDPSDTQDPENPWDEDLFRTDLGPVLGVGGLHATEVGERTEVVGWARVDGQAVTATDPTGDAGLLGAAMGLDLTAASVTHRPERADLLVRLDVTSLPTAHSPAPTCCDNGLVTGRVPGGGVPGAVYELALDVDGVPHVVRLTAHANADEVVLSPGLPHEIELLRCDGDCVVVDSPRGSLGTIGDSVLVEVPLAMLGADHGSTLTGVEARAGLAVGTDEARDAVALHDLTLAAPSVAVGPGPDGPWTAAGLAQGRFTATLSGTPDTLWTRTCLAQRCDVRRHG